MKTTWIDILDCFLWGLEFLSRKDCGLILAGIRQLESDRQSARLLRRLTEEKLIRQEGRGPTAKFVLTEAGAQRVAEPDPQRCWNTSWDGRWRLFSYDLPESRRKERLALWRVLRERRMGLLQRSVWVWPHDVETSLRMVLKVTGIPECFCGFTCDSLFLCTNEELVATAWDFGGIARDHSEYLRSASERLTILKRAKDLRLVAELAAKERAVHLQAWSRDPLLPRSLWLEGYAGPAVQRAHAQFRAELRQRAAALTEG